MNDRTQPCVLDISNPRRVFGYVNVDNRGPHHLNLRRTHEGFKSLRNEFDAVGLRNHEASLVRTCGLHSDKCSTVANMSPNPLSCPMVAALPRAGCFVEAESRDWSHCGTNNRLAHFVSLCRRDLHPVVEFGAFRTFPPLCLDGVSGIKGGAQWIWKTSLCWSQQSPLASLSLVSWNLSEAIVFGGQHDVLHWHQNGDGLMCTACWFTFGASLPFVGVVTCFRRCAGSREHGLLHDASQSVLARQEGKRTRNAKPRPSPYSSQDSFTSQAAALHPVIQMTQMM